MWKQLLVLSWVFIEFSWSEEYVDEDPDHECPDSEHYWEDSDYKMCREHAENDFLLNAKQQGMCGLLNKVSDDCLREFENCFAPNVFQDVKDLSLIWEVEKLAKLFGIGDSVKDCPISKEYASRTGKNLDDHSQTDECNEYEVKKVLSEYRVCGNRLRDKFALQIRDPSERRGEVRQVICDHLDELITQCFDHLEPCFASKYVWSLKRYQKELMGAFFYQMASDYGFHIRDCPIFQRKETFNEVDAELERLRKKDQDLFWSKKYNIGASTNLKGALSWILVILGVALVGV
ncbi:hypothetical protein TCAL_06584 [Tigriopus californicus]|uniref:Uncharacterized protein n=1 Tax=Tigriopus californicus TaxID=6832 RepID=A0A553PPQ6_TIGCA|nr:uncharacterized protein LOC131882536 [Tigriopus californicus]TRY79656.1 hypothetical protein TCAL_06584 [Tigriopus californicus]|eukprot:TCALIF_06584-PA protein Name:"Protein of unknown function" AED:0.00 eAED:0.00 QI:141/1/1/1/1/1/2/260/289